MISQIILVLAVIVLIAYFLAGGDSIKHNAGRKLLFVAFSLIAILTIIYPEVLTILANKIGIGRGADLLLYCLTFGFIFVVMTTYAKFKTYEHKLNKLARHIAVSEARYNSPRFQKTKVKK